jgi:hypothetical protein
MKSWMIVVLLSAGIWGCVGDGEPTLLPNADPALRKNALQLTSDAARRSYEASAPRGTDPQARAQYNLMSGNFELVNLSGQDWTNVEVWVNQTYVLFVPKMEMNVAKRLDFNMFYDQHAHHFATEDGKTPLQSLEIYHDGTLYTVPATME